MILKNYLKDSRIRKNIGCGVLALSCLISTQVSSTSQRDIKDQKEDKKIYSINNDLDLLHPYISLAPSDQKTNDEANDILDSEEINPEELEPKELEPEDNSQDKIEENVPSEDVIEEEKPLNAMAPEENEVTNDGDIDNPTEDETNDYDNEELELPFVGLTPNLGMVPEGEYVPVQKIVQSDIDPLYLNKMEETGFTNLSIGEMQAYILNYYDVKYEDLVNAITFTPGENATDGARMIVEREDFDEIKAFFTYLTDRKFDYVITRRNESLENLEVFFKTGLGECGEFYYTEGYLFANSVDNRIKSEEWNKKGKRNTLHAQIVAPGQYSIYLNGAYKAYNDIRKYSTTYGILDYLLLEVSVHDYTSFRSSDNPYGVKLTRWGDKYRSPIVTYRENKELVNVEPVNFEIVLHLLKDGETYDKVIGENPILELDELVIDEDQAILVLEK